MMDTVTVPPFERFYEAWSGEILAFLRRRLDAADAEDAFQETFLRALRGYDRLEHGRELRAWAYTIAARVAADVRRPAYAEIEHLADGLPPTERAAVVLRYGYDLSYEDIGAALGSSADAARQATSSGIRRLRRKELH
jgi:DNA-directed RNA polymerase specialized sigma24 family protein